MQPPSRRGLGPASRVSIVRASDPREPRKASARRAWQRRTCSICQNHRFVAQGRL